MSVGLSEYITNTMIFLKKSIPTDFRQYSDSPTDEKEVHTMGVYRLENGEFSRVGEWLGDMVPAEIFETTSVHAPMNRIGFVLDDDIDDTFFIYCRAAADSEYLPGVRWVFDVPCGADAYDTVLIGDSLPDYLVMMEKLQPLIKRAREVAAEV